jgi:IclR family transcriptional regulator, pca regulon regulatory protein
MGRWPDKPSRRFSGSVGKAFQILATFDVHRPELTASEIAAETGLDRSTTHRFLTTLVDIGVLVQDGDSRRYHLGLPVLDYAYVLLNTLQIRRIALSHLHELHREVEGTLSLGVRDGTEVVLVERSFGPWVPSGGFEIGQRLPMHASATGLAMLAFLDPDELETIVHDVQLEPRTPHTLRSQAALSERLVEIRRRGYATSDEELLVGLRSIAVPILGERGAAVAAISLARRTSVSGSIDELAREFAPRLEAVAERISAALGHRPFVAARPERPRN